MLKVTCQTAIATQPAKRSFHDPAMRQDFETLCLIGATDNFKFPTKGLAHFLNNTDISRISPEEYQATPRMMNTAFDGHKQLLQYLITTSTVLETGTVNQNDEE